ncbi:FAD/NAD(P)-binding domain-containing protein [Auriculariales sp. MPI-PUGE-AT-0066]|nr:FAD/NAD(P)-binding domain-containing protein [Auriculariales sp. MPI-PUGE-AT-0066]
MASAGKLNIVIVGGGGLASSLLGQLGAKIDRTKYRIVLINPRPFYIHLLVGARATVTDDGQWAAKAQIPFDRVLGPDDELIVGKAAGIHRAPQVTGGHVVLEDGTEVPFAILVLATGSTWPNGLNWPHTKEKIDAWLEEHRARVLAARSIVVAGGGALGMEIAGELRHFHPNKEVTLVQRSQHMLNDAYPERFRSYAEMRLRETGVNIVLDDTVVGSEVNDGVVTTASGKRLSADILIQAVGTKPNTGFLSNLGDTALSRTGHVLTKPTLQLTSFPEIFAGGDIIEGTEQKTISKTSSQASVIAANVAALSRGIEPTKRYTGFIEMLALQFGPSKGVSYFELLWGLVFGNWVTRMLKKEYALGMVRGSLNYKQ